MIKIAIVEDEKEYYEMFQEYLTRYEKETKTAMQYTVFQDGMSFLDEYKGDFDLILMDIVMPNINGLETAKKLRKIDERVCIIFITTVAKYAIDGYEVNALDFIVKPVAYDLFRIKLEKAFAHIDYVTDLSYNIETPGGIVRVLQRDITYVESDKHYLIYHLKDGRNLKYRGKKLKQVASELQKECFAFVGRSILVNLVYVDSIDGLTVVVNKEHLPLSRVYKADLLKKLTSFLGGGYR